MREQDIRSTAFSMQNRKCAKVRNRNDKTGRDVLL